MITLQEAINEVDKEQYFIAMYNRNRIIVAYNNDNQILGIASYCVTDYPKSLVRDEVWSVPEDSSHGAYVCIDRAFSKLENTRYALKVSRVVIEKLKDMYPDKQVLWFSRRKKDAVYC